MQSFNEMNSAFDKVVFASKKVHIAIFNFLPTL